MLLLIRHLTFCENHALDNIFQTLFLGLGLWFGIDHVRFQFLI
jgi:hypothetical protein